MSKALAKINKYLATKNQLVPPLKLQNEDDVRALNYYRDELKVQIERFETFKEKMNSIIEKGKQQEYLNEFRDMLSGYCISRNRTVTIIQCTHIIRRDECKFQIQCNTRKQIIHLRISIE